MARIRTFLRQQRWKLFEVDIVKTFGPREYLTNAGTWRQEKSIYLGRHLRKTPRKRMMILLHEAGHVLQYKLAFGVMHVHVWGEGGRGNQANEEFAFLLGTALARELGITLNVRAWNDLNWEARSSLQPASARALSLSSGSTTARSPGSARRAPRGKRTAARQRRG